MFVYSSQDEDDCVAAVYYSLIVVLLLDQRYLLYIVFLTVVLLFAFLCSLAFVVINSIPILHANIITSYGSINRLCASCFLQHTFLMKPLGLPLGRRHLFVLPLLVTLP